MQFKVPSDFKRAILARCITNNDLTGITEQVPPSDYDLPYQIWYPDVACWQTYAELSRRRPEMKEQIARACIVADFSGLYKEMDIDANFYLLREARDAANPFFLQDQERKVEAAGGIKALNSAEAWKWRTRGRELAPASLTLKKNITEGCGVYTDVDGIYDDWHVDVGNIITNISYPDDFKKQLEVDIKEEFCR